MNRGLGRESEIWGGGVRGGGMRVEEDGREWRCGGDGSFYAGFT